MAGVGGGYRESRQDSQAIEIPRVWEYAPMLSYWYLNQLPLIMSGVRKEIPKLEDVYTQAQIESFNKLSEAEQNKLANILGLERGATDAEAQAALERYQGPESALQRAQAETSLGIDKAINPEFYSAREQTGKALSDLLSPTLTGGELSNIERGLNRQMIQSGTFNVPGNIQQLNAALTYGGAGRNRQLQGVQAAKDVIPTFTSGVKTAPPVTTQKNISQAFAKSTPSGAQDITGNLLFNPTQQALQAYMTALGIPHSTGQSQGFDFSIGS